MTSATPKLLLDEHIWRGLAAALVNRGFDAVHLIDTGHRGIDDDGVLALLRLIVEQC